MGFWRRDKQIVHQRATNVTTHTQQVDGDNFEGKDVSVVSILVPFIKNLGLATNPAKFPYPAQFYLPQSSLMHMVYLQMNYVDSLIEACQQPTPLDRFLAFVKYQFSTYALTKFPYKPVISVLGETAHYSSPYCGSPDLANKTYAIAETVTTEIPLSCFYIVNPAYGVTYEGAIDMCPQFKQAHVTVRFAGQTKATFAPPQGPLEEYTSQLPDLSIHLLRMHTEFSGDVTISSSTGYVAHIIFREKALFGKTKNQVSGTITFNGFTIFTIDGAWDDAIYLTNVTTLKCFELLNKATARRNVLETPPIDQQPASSCYKIWGQMFGALMREDWATALATKEEIQRQELDRAHTVAGVPRYFVKNSMGVWQIRDPSLAMNYGQEVVGGEARI